MISSFVSAVMAQPIWVIVWITWMGMVNMAGVAFLKHPEGRWALAAMMGAGMSMFLLNDSFGYVRLLGLAHVLFWTPLWIYLWKKLKTGDQPAPVRIWMKLVLLTNGVSLIIDYIDVVRYVFGDRAPLA